MSLYRFSTYTYGKTVSEEKEILKIEMRNTSTRRRGEEGDDGDKKDRDRSRVSFFRYRSQHRC